MPELLDARRLHEKRAFKKAIHVYEAYLKEKPNDPEAHRLMGLAFAQSNDIERAITCFTNALIHSPDNAHVHHLLGNAYKQTNQFDKAFIHYQAAATLMPDNSNACQNALFYQGLLSLQHNNIDKAADEFHALLSEYPEHVGALINLGVIALKHNEGQLAIDYFGKALAFDEHNEEARNNLAATFIHHNRFENALTHYTELLKKSPNDTEYLYNAGVAHMTLGHLNEATHQFNAVLKFQPHHFAALTNLASIALRNSNRSEAITYLTRAHDINPQDKSCAFLLNAMTGNTENQTACPEYAQNLFDHYALYYDQHMRVQLKYSLPEHIAKLIHSLYADSLNVKNTLDLGCGTGLCGNVLREISTHLVGVDISSQMIEQARSKNLYDRLIEQDLISFLENESNTYELIIAADVLPYFSELEPFFNLIRQHLTPKGIVILSVEESKHRAFQLEDTARFSHHPDYIKDLANTNHLDLIFHEPVIGRMQAHLGVPVLLYAFTLKQDEQC